MRAFVVTAPKTFEIQNVSPPIAGPGEALIQIVRVGVCGTDIEFFNGDMPYLHDGQAKYPIRIGHEWTGTVIGLGNGTDSKLLGKRVTGDVMMGCGNCNRCSDGRQHTCVDRYEMGIRNGWNGALAEQLVIPTRFLHLLRDSIDDTVGALVEPGANAWRVAVAAQATPGKRILIWGTGTIGLYTLLFAKAMGAEVHMIGKDPATIELALELGATSAGEELTAFKDGYNSIVDATFDPSIPAKAVDLVEPGGHVVLIGVDSNGAPIDSRKLVFKDVTVVGILSGSPGLSHSIEFIASGRVDPRPLVGATVGLSEVGSFFMGVRPIGAGVGPKILVDPTR
jgi:threonine dehydrogenase-like Zn-dependent dehydrogenase